MLDASQVYTCTIGDTARISSRRSDREHFKDFTKYRAWKENISFAVIEKGNLTAKCLNHDLKPFCLRKVQFQVWNKTHLLLEIKNASYEDGGEYGVEHVFGGLEGNAKDKISLEIKGTLVNEIQNHSSTMKNMAKSFTMVSAPLIVIFKSSEKYAGERREYFTNFYGEAPPRVHHLPGFVCRFDRNRYPFHVPFIEKRYPPPPFHMST